MASIGTCEMVVKVKVDMTFIDLMKLRALYRLSHRKRVTIEELILRDKTSKGV